MTGGRDYLDVPFVGSGWGWPDGGISRATVKVERQVGMVRVGIVDEETGEIGRLWLGPAAATELAGELAASAAQADQEEKGRP
jgi:hypothetical protein